MASIFDLFQRPIYAGIVEGTIRRLRPKVVGIDNSKTRLKATNGAAGFLARISSILQVSNPAFTSTLAEDHFNLSFDKFGRLKVMKKIGFKKEVYTNGREFWTFDV